MLQRFSNILDTRRKSKRFRAILLFIFILIFSGVLVACGTGSNTEPSPTAEFSALPSANSSSASTETSATEAPATSSASTTVSESPPTEESIPYQVTVSDDKTRTFMASEDGQAMEQVAKAFTEAYLAGNQEEMKKYLTNPEHRQNHYPTKTEHQTIKSINLKTEMDERKEGLQIVSMELAYTDKDVYLYLTLEVKKTPSRWMIDWYGLEQ